MKRIIRKSFLEQKKNIGLAELTFGLADMILLRKDSQTQTHRQAKHRLHAGHADRFAAQR